MLEEVLVASLNQIGILTETLTFSRPNSKEGRDRLTWPPDVRYIQPEAQDIVDPVENCYYSYLIKNALLISFSDNVGLSLAISRHWKIRVN